MTLAILQARMSSTRLPGKVLELVGGKPMIMQQIARLRHSSEISKLVVATSTEESDDVLAETLEDHGVAVFRGPLDDVFSRFRLILSETNACEFVRLTADCPLTDPRVIDDLIDLHKEDKNDYTSNTLNRTFPHGFDAEVVSTEKFLDIKVNQLTDFQKEHVTPYFYQNPKEFKLGNLLNFKDFSKLRLTVDYPEDLENVREIYQNFANTDFFSTDDIINFLRG